MPTSIGTGFSQEILNADAAKEASLQCIQQMGSDDCDLIIIFHTIHYDAHILTFTIRDIIKNKKIIGCSTAGLILSTSIETRGVALLIIKSDEIKFGSSAVDNLSNEDAHTFGMALAQNALTDFGSFQRHGFLLFMDGLLKNNSLFLKGIQDVLGTIFPIVGAGSSDDFHFGENFQIHQDRIMTNAASALMIGGQMHIGVGGGHGWKPVGKPRLIDDSQGHIIKEIDGKIASEVYEEYLGNAIEGLRNSQLEQMAILYPLGIYVDDSNHYLLRNAVNITPEGYIICQGDIPKGSSVHVMIGNKDSCKEAAHEAAKEAYKNLLGKEAKLILVLESMARLKLLGRMAFQEVEQIKSVFGPNVPIFGMYANGEICPVQTEEAMKKPHHQNESIVIIALS